MDERSCKNCEHFCCDVGIDGFMCNKISTAQRANVVETGFATLLPGICRHYSERVETTGLGKPCPRCEAGAEILGRIRMTDQPDLSILSQLRKIFEGSEI